MLNLLGMIESYVMIFYGVSRKILIAEIKSDEQKMFEFD
jgi:hypothetical protein